ncbi:MAG: hypothetical protein J1E36_08505 [Eubacterium sp.]|nr:hypothetical protein [Eubacterium sp.]
MIEKLIMSENNIPDGILHDQDLYKVELNNKEFTLSFNTHLFSDQVGIEFCEQYKDFTKCHIKCKLEDEYFCNVELKTSLNKKDVYKVKVLSVSEFVKIANEELNKEAGKGHYPWEYLNTYISPGIKSAVIELSIWLKYKGVEYTMCNLQLNTNEIEYIWE